MQHRPSGVAQAACRPRKGSRDPPMLCDHRDAPATAEAPRNTQSSVCRNHVPTCTQVSPSRWGCQGSGWEERTTFPFGPRSSCKLCTLKLLRRATFCPSSQEGLRGFPVRGARFYSHKRSRSHTTAPNGAPGGSPGPGLPAHRRSSAPLP